MISIPTPSFLKPDSDSFKERKWNPFFQKQVGTSYLTFLLSLLSLLSLLLVSFLSERSSRVSLIIFFLGKLWNCMKSSVLEIYPHTKWEVKKWNFVCANAWRGTQCHPQVNRVKQDLYINIINLLSFPYFLELYFADAQKSWQILVCSAQLSETMPSFRKCILSQHHQKLFALPICRQQNTAKKEKNW